MSSSSTTTNGSSPTRTTTTKSSSTSDVPQATGNGPREATGTRERLLLVPGSTVQAASFLSLDHLDAATITQDDDDNGNDENQDQAQASARAPAPEPSEYSPSSPPPRHTWEGTPASAFHIRGPHYKRAGRKQPSLDSFYTLVSFDLVKTPAGCVNHVARFIDLEKLRPTRSHPGFPPLFVVNTQLPDSEPAMFKSAEDGPSRSAILVFALKASTVDLLEKHHQEQASGYACCDSTPRRATVDQRSSERVIASSALVL